MNEVPQRKSRIWWCVLAVVAAPLLYMLSVPWVGVLFVKTGHRHSLIYQAYAWPLALTINQNFLEQPVSLYMIWCFQAAGE